MGNLEAWHGKAIFFENEKVNAHKLTNLVWKWLLHSSIGQRTKKEMSFHDRLSILSLNLPIMASSSNSLDQMASS
jgi:hypothetical protein